MSVSRRIKPDNLVSVRDLQEANGVLAEIAHLQRSIDAIEADMQVTIDRIRRSAAAFAAPRRARLESLTKGLSTFAECNKAVLFARRRGIELAHGAMGFRRSSELRPGVRGGWAQVLGRIKALGVGEALRIREDVNREALRGWSDERLVEVGVRRLEKDLFWYELKLDGVQVESVTSAHNTGSGQEGDA